MSDPNYVVGRGRIYFDQFAPDTKEGAGELYLGNTPTLRIKSAVTTADTYDSVNGVKTKTASVVLKDDMSGAFTTDNISPENLASWFSGDAAYESRFAEQAQAQQIKVKRGRFYQVGKSLSRPQGARNITNFNLFVGSALVPAADNYTLDLQLGRLYVLEDAALLLDDLAASLTFDIKSATALSVISKGRTIEGSLRFMSENVAGLQKHFFYPYVSLTPNDNYELKGDDWQELSFEFEILRLNDLTERVYIDADPLVVGPSPNEEQALHYGTEAEIIVWVNKWYQMIHVQLPDIAKYQIPIGTDDEVIAWVNQFDATVNVSLPSIFN